MLLNGVDRYIHHDILQEVGSRVTDGACEDFIPNDCPAINADHPYYGKPCFMACPNGTLYQMAAWGGMLIL